MKSKNLDPDFRIAVVIPAFNEAKNLPSLINELRKIQEAEFQLVPIIVNDCSKDDTAAVARSLKVDLIDLPVNLGIGGAVQSGMIYAYESGFQYAMQLDGDGQHPPSEISKMVAAMKKSGFSVVIGSRFLEADGFQSSSLRRAGIRYLKGVIKFLTGLQITDATSGFRLYNRKALAAIAANYPDEYPEPEAIIYFHKKKLTIGETPVIMRHRQAGKSSISFINSFYYFWKVSLAIIYAYLKV
ncbi:MAG: glycosyltransferase family 2 protein [Bacteroidales bacterium]|nr:glycosyltransferase family 2 protein [Bacteroidales bacterium]